MMAKLKMENCNFLLNFKLSKDVALKVDVNSNSWLWPRRLRHLNFKGLKSL